VLSPVLDCVYIDDLLLALSNSGVGCYIRNNFVGALAYADDITSQRGSAWHCYIGPLLSIGKKQFSTSQSGKTNEYFVIKLGRRDYAFDRAFDYCKLFKLLIKRHLPAHVIAD